MVMFGGLHIEIAALKALGDLLENSGWTDALIQAYRPVLAHLGQQIRF